MSEPINIRDLIRRGAPANGDEVREIITALHRAFCKPGR